MASGQRLLIVVTAILPLIYANKVILEKTLSFWDACKKGISDCSVDDTQHHALCGSCTSFVKCGGPAASSVMNCPAGLIYDMVLQVCNWEDNALVGCRLSTPSSSAAQITSQAATEEGRQVTSAEPALPLQGAEGKIRSSKIAGCLDACGDSPPGVYPSCIGCQYYLVCIEDIPLSDQLNQCPEELLWDNEARKCLPTSSTCT
ncbi:chondroitin proteoglycan-2-like [Littorina saxatilis]